ncbi:hypothetical protein [Thermoactinomyces mirandus]|uniref:Uncharacterized protein n=1 Tax=Thermoactinomyces mirandus TaxID=2756294 RepID=A0A7W1XS77_9BACL|nr:hypothetical protein [Thermoactinomyces mirandus]MBA4602190.1 hypothetical protein [Thermoactinomyces mirandus]
MERGSCIVLKADKGLVSLQYDTNLLMKPCAICNEVHVEMSEFCIGFFEEGTDKPVCLECAKKYNPLLYSLWEMGISSHDTELLEVAVKKFNKIYKKARE